MQATDPVSRLVYELSKLPGIGEKTATRLAYFIIKQDTSYVTALSQALLQAKTEIHLCAECFTFTAESVCKICSSSDRDRSTLCVIEKPSDVHPIEQTGTHRGIYHILHGTISPLEGVGPDDLKIKELLSRLANSSVREVVLAMNPNVEGEATSLYLSRLIKNTGLELSGAPIRVTQLAYGIPVGGMLEYTDRQTLGRAMQNRVEVSS